MSNKLEPHENRRITFIIRAPNSVRFYRHSGPEPSSAADCAWPTQVHPGVQAEHEKFVNTKIDLQPECNHADTTAIGYPK